MVDPNIKKKADDIRNKVYGKEVRESLASGLEAMSSDVVETVGRQDEVESQFQDVIENTTDKDVISAPEIIAARDGESNLKARLDKEKNEVTTQLGHTGDLAGDAYSNNTVISPKSPTGKGFIVFVDDDARREVLTKLKPLSDEYGIPFTLAVPVRNIETTPSQDLTPAELVSLQSQGWEMASHSYTHIGLHGQPREVVEFELRESKKELESWGLNIKNYVAPYGHIEEPMIREIASKYYNTASRAQGGVNKRPVKNYYLHRPPLGSFFSGDEGTLEFYKAKVDEAYNGDNLLIFMTHVWADEHDDVQQGYLRSVIEYALSLGMPIGNMQEGYERYGNMLEVEGGTAIGNDGAPFGFLKETTYKKVGPGSSPQDISFTTAPIDIFTHHKNRTIETSFFMSLNQPFPKSRSGTLISHAHDSTLDIWQEWHPNNSPQTVYYRHAISSNEWSDFKPTPAVSVIAFPGEDEKDIMLDTTPIEIRENYKEKIIHVVFSSWNNQNFPESQAGELITHSLTSVDNMWQEWHPYGKAHLVYYRNALENGSGWTAFKQSNEV